MFRRHDVHLMSNPSCTKKVEGLELEDFRYYDKDGFELNLAEQKFYAAMGFPIWHNCLNHHCWQEPWFELDVAAPNLILDHSMFLCRCNYDREAADQLQALKSLTPTADLLLKTRRKWGFDFALDAVTEDGTVYEVLHVEYDHYDYDYFKNRLINFEWSVRHTDWQDAAKQIWSSKDQWENLSGFAQNDWKARYLLGWSKSEYTHKTV
jgi:hypothetical protein